MTYKKLVRHKRKSRKETKAFSSNTSKKIFVTKDGSYLEQSHLSGKYNYVKKKR